MARIWRSHPLEDGCPPEWASGWGQDQYGIFTEFTVGEVKQRLRWIPPGRFLMGSLVSEKGQWVFEGPQHEEVIEEGFWLFDTPCTQALWEAVLGTEANKSRFRGARRPVEKVSWENAVKFTKKLNELLPGLGCRLPSEAEWEYACRAGSQEPRYGDIDAIAWYGENSEGETHEVGLKQPNAWGLYDMLGNVWEWCEDKWRDENPNFPSAVYDKFYMIRGGSWSSELNGIRMAFRAANPPENGYDYLGFRCLSSGN